MIKTDCNGHRVVGYYLSNGAWLCRQCDASEAMHETTDETIARNRAQAN